MGALIFFPATVGPRAALGALLLVGAVDVVRLGEVNARLPFMLLTICAPFARPIEEVVELCLLLSLLLDVELFELGEVFTPSSGSDCDAMVSIAASKLWGGEGRYDFLVCDRGGVIDEPLLLLLSGFACVSVGDSTFSIFSLASTDTTEGGADLSVL
jgi:hypothetical protein